MKLADTHPKSQIPDPKRRGRGALGIVVFGISFGISFGIYFGIWDLGFGIFDLRFQISGFAQSVIDNPHVRVSRNAAPCAGGGAECGDRIVVALGDIELGPIRLRRGEIQVFPRAQTYLAPHGDFLEVAVKPRRPPVKSPAVLIPPDKNDVLYDGEEFFVFEEKLDPGDTRARHSHRERVVIVINETRLQQWPDGAPELFREQVPNDVRFNPPVVHVVKTVGERPLRNIVIEFKR